MFFLIISLSLTYVFLVDNQYIAVDTLLYPYALPIDPSLILTQFFA